VDDCIAVLHLLQRARMPAMACVFHASGILKARGGTRLFRCTCCELRVASYR